MPRLPLRLALAGALLATPVAAQQSTPAASFSPAQRAEIVAIVRQALQDDPTILRDAVTALQQATASQQDAAASRAIVAHRQELFARATDPVAGNPRGTVTLVEFFDVRCPYCRKMLPAIAQWLHATPDARLILKDLPILGPASVLGAKALLAAHQQGAYLSMQEALMQPGAEVSEDGIAAAARRLKLDLPRLQAAMASPQITAQLNANLTLAAALNIQGTPAFIVGDRLVSGAMEIGELTRASDSLRAAAGK